MRSRMQVLNVLFYELPLSELQNFRERVNAVTVDDIQRVARLYLKPDRLSVVLVGNAAAFTSQLAGRRLRAVRDDRARQSRSDRRQLQARQGRPAGRRRLQLDRVPNAVAVAETVRRSRKRARRRKRCSIAWSPRRAGSRRCAAIKTIDRRHDRAAASAGRQRGAARDDHVSAVSRISVRVETKLPDAARSRQVYDGQHGWVRDPRRRPRRARSGAAPRCRDGIQARHRRLAAGGGRRHRARARAAGRQGRRTAASTTPSSSRAPASIRSSSRSIPTPASSPSRHSCRCARPADRRGALQRLQADRRRAGAFTRPRAGGQPQSASATSTDITFNAPARSRAVQTSPALTTRLLLSCGEPSGDLYAGALTRELRALDPHATVAGLGGPQFAAAGGGSSTTIAASR